MLVVGWVGRLEGNGEGRDGWERNPPEERSGDNGQFNLLHEKNANS